MDLCALEVDAIVAKSLVLSRMLAAAPEVVRGPINLKDQHWISAGSLPCKSRFIGAIEGLDPLASIKPIKFGLYTSTGIAGGPGMWRAYLNWNEGSTLCPLPWCTWVVEIGPDVVVREITSEVEWVEFVQSYPQKSEGLLYPDWCAIARDYAGVHMTIRAIAATQGFCFSVPGGLIASPTWDVESTVWLRWCFRSTTLIDKYLGDDTRICWSGP